MRNIKLIIGYNGRKFKGWQRLGDGKRTIQGTLEKILSDILGEDIQVIGCGRTDAGVHALSYVLNFHTESKMKVGEIEEQFTKKAPLDIIIFSAKECSERFHARYNIKQKTYLYKIDNGKQCDLFTRENKLHIPEDLDLEKMKAAAEILIGEHDFQSFTTLKAKNKSTVRTIHKIDIIKNKSDVEIRISAEGFLWNMVRIIVGTLIEVGKGELESYEVQEILDRKVRAEAPGKVDAKALYLENVEY